MIVDYFEDERIIEILDEIDHYHHKMKLARMREDYASVCFCVGCISGLVTRLHILNDQIEREENT